MTPTQATAPAPAKAKSRRGVVIVAVLVVVAVLSLAAYQYADLMLSESRASNNAFKIIQARMLATSAVNYTAAMLRDVDNGPLGGNPWNNPQAFQNILIPGPNGLQMRFSVIAPPDPN